MKRYCYLIKLVSRNLINFLSLRGTYQRSAFQDPRGQFFSTDTNSELVLCLKNSGMPSDEIVKRVQKILM